MNFCNLHEHHASRRQILSAGAVAGFGGILHPLNAEKLASNDKQILFIWLDGGISQLESWDPKPNTQFGGPFRSIPTSLPGVHFSELMPNSAKIAHKLCVVRSLCTQDNSHSAGVGRIQRGDPKNRGVVYPYFGSAVAKLLGPTQSKLPPYVWIKPGSGGFKTEDAGFLPPKYGSLAFGDGKPPENLLRLPGMSEDFDQARNSLRDKLNRHYSQQRYKRFTEANTHVFDTAERLMKRADIFDTSKIPQKEIDKYGNTEIGLHTLIGRNMIEAGVRFVKVNSYGWDTHADNFNGQDNLISKFDRAFAAVVNDLDDRGLLKNTLVIAMSEFGRTPRINGHVGRDHWPEAWSVAMAGCGVQKGAVIGETNDKGTWVKTDPYDIGHVFHTWYHALGINSYKTEFDNNGQPLPIAHDEMDAIKDVLL